METDARKPNILILLAGLGTSFICLLAVYFLNKVDLNLMGLYILFIIPAGGLIVGAGSGTGYMIASRLFNVRIKKIYFLFIFIIALATYAASHYVTYLALLDEVDLAQGDVSFFQYLQLNTESTTYSLRSGNEGIALGKFGYLFLVIEAIGFSIGVFLPAFFLSLAAYCPECQLYMKKIQMVNLISTATTDDFKKKSLKEKRALIDEAILEVKNKYLSLVPDLEKKSVEEIKSLLEQYNAKPGKRIAYVQLLFYKCPHCDIASIRSSINNLGPDNKLVSQKLGEIKKGGFAVA